VAKETGKKQAEDLELTPDKAGEVKGGLLPSEPGGPPGGRHVSAKHKVHHKKGHQIQGPIRGMPHE
jgi:hypothetical protein